MKKCLDLGKLQNRKKTIITSEEALKDVTPIVWSNDILTGKKKVTVCSCKR